MKNRLDKIYEDEDLLILNKPSGLLSIPDRYDPTIPNLYHLLNREYEKVFTVHRLDRETSGLICFAKTEEAHRHLSLQFENRTVEKYYLAFVDGHPYPAEGTIDLPLMANPNSHQEEKIIAHRNGKPAETIYKTLETFQTMSFMEVQIKTGRTHQIRVHFKEIGHPLVIDSVYGARDAFFLSHIKGKKYRLGKYKEERPLVTRCTLHAAKLSFDHPTSGARKTVEAPLTKDLNALLKQLRKWST